MDYKILAFGATLIFSGLVVLIKYITKYEVKDRNTFFFWSYVSALPFALFLPLITPIDFKMVLIIPMLFQSLFQVLGMWCFVRGIYKLDASVVSPLFQLQTGFILILATLFLGEKYDPSTYLYLLLLIIGAMFASVTDKVKLKGFFQPAVLFILAMQLFHAGSNISTGFALKHANNWQVMFFSFIFSSLFVSMFAAKEKYSLKLNPRQAGFMLLRGAMLFSGNAFLIKAYETNISISSAIALLSSPLVFAISVLSAVIVPGFLERQSGKTYFIRAIGMLVIVLGVWKITLLK